MARSVDFTTEGEEALAAATAETILQVRGVTTVKWEVAEINISGDQEVTTEVENIRIRVLYQSTDGTATAATESQSDPDDPTTALTGFHSFTAEPTAGQVKIDDEIPANGSFYRYYAEGDSPIIIDAATSSRVGIEATASAVVNVTGTLRLRPVCA